MSKQAEAERERRTKVINAEGEFQAAAKLAQAAEVQARLHSGSPRNRPTTEGPATWWYDSLLGKTSRPGGILLFR